VSFVEPRSLLRADWYEAANFRAADTVRNHGSMDSHDEGRKELKQRAADHVKKADVR